MKSFKRIIFLILLVFFSVLVVACKKDNNDPKKDPVEIEYTLNAELDSSTIRVDDEVDLSVFFDEDKTISLNPTITVEDETIASFNNGKLKGLSVGSTKVNVSVTFNEQTYSASVTLKVVARDDYELVLSNVVDVCFIGDELEIKAKIENVDITDFQVFFSKGLCKFENGKIVALKVGTEEVTVHANYKGSNVTTSFNLTVKEHAPADKYKFESNLPEELLLYQVIDEITLKEANSNKAITDFTITSSDEDIIYIEGKSLEVIDNGKANIEFKFKFDDEEFTFVLEYTISRKLGLMVEYDSEVFVGESVNIKVISLPDNVEITEYTLSSRDSTVSIDGKKITGVEKGKATVNLKALVYGTEVSYTLNLKINPEIQYSLSTNIPDNIFSNEEYNVLVNVLPNNEELATFTVTSSNESVLKVEANKISALTLGEAELTIKGNYNNKELTLTKKVTVNQFGDLDVSVEEELHLNEMSKYQLLINGVKVSPSKVSVDNDVLVFNDKFVLARKEGNAKLTLEYEYLGQKYDITKDISVTVFKYEVERIKLIPSLNFDFSGEAYIGHAGSYLNLLVKYEPAFVKVESIYDLITMRTDNEQFGVIGEGTGTDGHKVFTLNLGNDAGKVNVVASLISNPSVNSTATVTIGTFDSQVDVSDASSGGSFYITSYMANNDLSCGVVQTTYRAFTKTLTPGLDVDGLGGLSQTIDNNEFYAQQVNILDVPSSTEIKIIPWANLDNNTWHLTSVKGLIENFEKHNPGLKVIAAINGDFFDINATKNLPYSTTGENISDGEFYKSSNIFGADGGTVGFTNDGSNLTLIAGNDATRTDYMVLNIYDSNGNIIDDEFNIDNWNGDAQTSIWYGTYNSEQNYVPITVTKGDSRLFIVSSAEVAVPNYEDDFYGRGVIDVVDADSYELQVGQFAIKTTNQALISKLNSGVKIRAQFEYTGRFANVMSATGYNCKIYDETEMPNHIAHGNLGNRAPRTVIGMREDGSIVMAVVDGRQGNKLMYGCDGYELAAMMKYFGCVNAYNLDGGGSSTMVIRTSEGLKVLNSPSDGHERSDGNCILICTKDPNYVVEEELGSSEVTLHVSIDDPELASYPTYVRIDTKFYPVVDGEVKITGLLHNSTYSYRIYYSKNNTLIETLKMGSFKTSKSGFKLLNAILYIDDDNYKISLEIEDKDKASSALDAIVSLNDITTHLTDGEVVLPKSYFGNTYDNIEIKFFYEENGEIINVVLNIDDLFISEMIAVDLD